MTFPKDQWIKDAILRRYLIVNEDGSIYRCDKADKNGNLLSTGYHLVKQQVHKPTGRVYFNMTWRGFTKSILVNRVVAWRFHPNPENLPQVNHINGNKEDNAKDNLEWATGSENEKHAHRTGLKTGRGSANSNAKVSVADVLQIRASEEPIEVLRERYGVSRSTITNIKNKRTWSHV